MLNTTDSTSPTRTVGAAEPPSLRYAWYALFVLMICYTLSFIDRQILSLLVGPILSDDVFKDEKMIGVGLAISIAIASVLQLITFGATLKPYRRHAEAMDAVAT